MCKSMTEGGQRCAAHTRPKVSKAAAAVEEAVASGDLNTVFEAREKWEKAAAEYASTNEGRDHFRAQAAAADATGNVDTAVMLNQIVTKGEQIRAANRETAALLAAVRMGEAQTVPTSMVPPLAQMAVAPAAPVVPDLSPRDRKAFDEMVEGLKDVSKDVTYFNALKPAVVIEGVEKVDETLGDATADDDDLAEALTRYDRAISSTFYHRPKTALERQRNAYSFERQTPEEVAAEEAHATAWRAWQSAALETYKCQYERALDHPNAGERTYRFVRQQLPGTTREITGRAGCPTPVLNEAMRDDYTPGGTGTANVHPDGWQRARDQRMSNPPLALTLAAKDPDTWQRHEALNQVVMTPFEEFSENDRAWLAENLHQIPGPENQKLLAASLVSFAKAYSDDGEKQRLSDIFAGKVTADGALRSGENHLSVEVQQIGAGLVSSAVSLERAEPKKKRWFAGA